VACEVALEAAHRLDAGLAFGFLAGEIGASRRVDPAARDRDDVQGAVELAVAATVQAVAVASPGGSRNRCDAGQPGELSVAGEALCARGLADQDRGAQRATAGLCEQLWAMGANEVAQLALERLGFPCERGDALDLLASDTDPGGLWQRPEPAGDALQLAGVVELARWNLRLELRVEHHEVPAQPVDQPGALGNEDLAVIAQQPDLDSLLIEEGSRESLDPLAQHGAGNRSRIDLVGLPDLAFAAARGAHQLRRDTQNTLAHANERALKPLRDVAAVLDRPDDLLAQLVGPAQPVEMSLLARGDLSLAE
jgi:hypothetical protein